MYDNGRIWMRALRPARKERYTMMKRIMAALACMLCMAVCAGALGEAPRLPDIGAYAGGRLTLDSTQEGETGLRSAYTGSRDDVRHAVNGYLALIRERYDLVQNAYFELGYSYQGENYGYIVRGFRYDGPQENAVTSIESGVDGMWRLDGACDLIVCYSQGRPEHEQIQCLYSRDFLYSDTGERLNVFGTIASGAARVLPDPGAYASGLLTLTQSQYRPGGRSWKAYTGASADVVRIRDAYAALLTGAFGMKIEDRAEWEHGHSHVNYSLRFMDEGASDLKTVKAYEEYKLSGGEAHVILRYTQGEDGTDTLWIEYNEQSIWLEDTGDRLKEAQ